MLAKISLVVVLLAGVSLIAIDVQQPERNAIAQAELAQAPPTPKFAQWVNQQVANAAKQASPGASGTPSAASAPGTPSAPSAPKTTVDAGGTAIHSVSVSFPAADHAFPPGPNVETVTNNCTACHSPGMILTQPKLSPAAWTGEVQKMQHTYKAPVDDADVPAIVAYLVTLPQPGQDK